MLSMVSFFRFDPMCAALDFFLGGESQTEFVLRDKKLYFGGKMCHVSCANCVRIKLKKIIRTPRIVTVVIADRDL